MTDYIVRASAADGQIRAFATTTRDMTEYAREVHNTSPIATAALGRTLAAGAMMGIMMKGEKDILTIRIKGDGPIAGITVTANSKAEVKGYVNNPEVMLPPSAKGKLDVGGAIGAGTLSVIMDLGLKEPYIGQTNLVTSEIAEDLTYYFATSDQVPSSVALGVLMNKDNTVKRAGGFIIQLMPFADDEIIDKLEAKLGQITGITDLLDQNMTPEMILEYVLGDFDLEILSKEPTSYVCDCSKERVEKAIITIGPKDISEMIDDNEPIEVNCHFCSKNYEFSVEELKDILLKSSKNII
ncbi:MAG TPA: Hsp33 family molecular chaperone HslO [Clostridiales bacterium]|nr:Hsp33 family molecular chaperone HslO [Clostridiales bacterium]